MRLSVCIVLVFLVILTENIQATRLQPSRPTHYFYTPTAYLNEPFDLVASFRELSWTLPQNLQVHLSLIDNIGRVCLGMRYGIADNLSVGGGLAYSLIKGAAGHGIHKPAKGRLGLYLTYGVIQDSQIEFAVTPHTQIGDRVSAGSDFSFMYTPSEYWSFISEVGLSVDFKDMLPWLNVIGGGRFHIPQLPLFSFDLGVELAEAPMENYEPEAKAFLDLIFTMKTK